MTQIKTPTRLCLVRHGETDWNAAGRLQGSTDIPLNEHGRRQALATAARLADERFDQIYSSDLGRAMDTARASAERLGLPIRPLASLRERDYGHIQGLTHDEALQRYPLLQPRLRAREPHATPPGGESLAVFSQRVQRAFEALAESHAGASLLIVSHGGVLDIAYRLATGMPLEAPRDFVIGNACINWIVHDGTDWQLESWGDDAHLTGALDELAG